MSSPLSFSNALFCATLAYAADTSSLKARLYSPLTAPLSLILYPLLEKSISEISKKYLPEPVRIIAALAGAILLSQTVVDHSTFGEVYKFDREHLDRKIQFRGKEFPVKARTFVVAGLFYLSYLISK